MCFSARFFTTTASDFVLMEVHWKISSDGSDRVTNLNPSRHLYYFHSIFDHPDLYQTLSIFPHVVQWVYQVSFVCFTLKFCLCLNLDSPMVCVFNTSIYN